MLKINTVQNSFTSGELSPRLLGRSDVDRYQSGAATIENFTVQSQGGLARRLGTQHLAFAHSQSTAVGTVRLIEFVRSRTEEFVIEFSADGTVRFIRDRSYIRSSGAIYTVTGLPYTLTELAEIQVSQSADVLYITHTNHPFATLSRYADDDWRYEIPVIDYGPYLDQKAGDQDTSLTVRQVYDRLVLTSTSADFDGVSLDSYVEYLHSGQRVLGQIKAIYSDYSVLVEPLEDRSLILSKEVYSPGLYTGWDTGTSTPSYDTDITGSGVQVAFSAVGVVTQEHIGNFLRFSDRGGTYYWMEVSAVGDIPRQGAYGILATGDIISPLIPAGTLTRSERVIAARLRSSDPEFFNLTTDANRLFRLVLGDTVVHCRSRSSLTYTLVGNANDGENKLYLGEVGLLLPGDAVTGPGIPADTFIVAVFADEVQTYALLNHNVTEDSLQGTFTINASTTQEIGVTLNRALPRSTEGLTTVQKGTTNDWNRGAWFYRNYPTTVSFHEGRLAFGGSALQPQTGWLSRVDDLYNFATTDEKLRVLDDCAITFTISSDTVNQILWMVSREVLLIGTAGEEWKVGSTSQGASLTPTTITVRSQSNYGSELIKPVRVGAAVIFFQRSGRKMREMRYDYATDSQVSLDLTVFAEHILKAHGGARQVCYQQLPEPVIYVLLGDGQVGVFSYEADQKIYAWTRFIIGGPGAVVESIACIPDGAVFRLYLSVCRTLSTGFTRTIECLEPEFRPTGPEDFSRMLFLDNYVTGGAGADYITGLVQFQGALVNVMVDNRVYPHLPVSDTGTITLPAVPASRYVIGFPYTSVLKTMPIEAQAQAGTGQGKVKRIDHVSVRVQDTINFSHGPSLDNLHEEVTGHLAMVSRDVRVPFDSGFNTHGQLCIVQEKSYPLTVLALMPELAQYQ